MSGYGADGRGENVSPDVYWSELVGPAYLLRLHVCCSWILVWLAVVLLLAAVSGVILLLWLGDDELDQVSQHG